MSEPRDFWVDLITGRATTDLEGTIAGFPESLAKEVRRRMIHVREVTEPPPLDPVVRELRDVFEKAKEVARGYSEPIGVVEWTIQDYFDAKFGGGK